MLNEKYNAKTQNTFALHWESWPFWICGAWSIHVFFHQKSLKFGLVISCGSTLHNSIHHSVDSDSAVLSCEELKNWDVKNGT